MVNVPDPQSSCQRAAYLHDRETLALPVPFPRFREAPILASIVAIPVPDRDRAVAIAATDECGCLPLTLPERRGWHEKTNRQ